MAVRGRGTESPLAPFGAVVASPFHQPAVGIPSRDHRPPTGRHHRYGHRGHASSGLVLPRRHRPYVGSAWRRTGPGSLDTSRSIAALHLPTHRSAVAAPGRTESIAYTVKCLYVDRDDPPPLGDVERRSTHLSGLQRPGHLQARRGLTPRLTQVVAASPAGGGLQPRCVALRSRRMAHLMRHRTAEPRDDWLRGALALSDRQMSRDRQGMTAGTATDRRRAMPR